MTINECVAVSGWELRGDSQFYEKTYPFDIFSTTNRISVDPGSKTASSGRKQASHRLSYLSALKVYNSEV
jgi:hypothetical protein